MTITEFLAARLDDDEQAAREADEYSRRVNGLDRTDAGMQHNMDLPALIVDERRVLREVAAKRHLLDAHDLRHDPCDAHDPVTMESEPCEVLIQFAAVYADHPDYREEWRPDLRT